MQFQVSVCRERFQLDRRCVWCLSFRFNHQAVVIWQFSKAGEWDASFACLPVKFFSLRFELSMQKAVLAFGRVSLPSKTSKKLLSTRLRNIHLKIECWFLVVKYLEEELLCTIQHRKGLPHPHPLGRFVAQIVLSSSRRCKILEIDNMGVANNW